MADKDRLVAAEEEIAALRQQIAGMQATLTALANALSMTQSQMLTHAHMDDLARQVRDVAASQQAVSERVEALAATTPPTT